MAEYITERSAGRILKDGIKIYAQNFTAIFLISALPVLPFLILSAWASSQYDDTTIVVSDFLQGVIGIFTTGAVTVAVSDVCLGNRPSVKRSYTALLGIIWRYLGTYLLAVLIIGIGLVLLVIPGIYAMVVLMFALPVCIIERRTALDACKRSRALGKGYYLRNFGVLILISCVFFIGVFAISMVLIAPVLMMDSEPPIFLFDLLGGLLGAALAPVVQVSIILLYYDMRVRKENFDGAALAQELTT